ncbi:MAG: hypothetical protein ACYC21_13855 [Eubacteriales bacterium]
MINSHKYNRLTAKSIKNLLNKIIMTVLVGVIATQIGCVKKPPKSQPKPQSKLTAALTYTSNIQPMLSKKCVSCHNPKGKVASIPLDSYANVIKQVKPGNPTDSRLVQAVDGGSMSGRLTNDEIKPLKEWVKQGVKK